MNSRRYQKEIESILRTLTSTNKEKSKLECSIKLITIFENSLEVDVNFDLLLQSIYELADCNNPSCHKVWIQVVNQVLKFRPKYREKLYDQAMKIVFDLNNDDLLKLKTLHILTNCCMEIPVWDDRIYDFLLFEGFLNEDLHKEILFIMISHLIKYFPIKIDKFMHEFIIETTIFICFKKICIFRENPEQGKNQLVEDEKVYLKSIFQLLENYMINTHEKDSMLVLNIIRIYCFYVNYDKEYSWMMMRLFINNDVKIIKYFMDLISNDSVPFENVCFNNFLYFSLDQFENEEKIKLLNDKYDIFINKLGNINNMLLKHRIRIIKGAIFFLGMAQWSYERIDKIDIPNSIFLAIFLKLVNKVNRKIDLEIILCLKRVIKKYGEELMDEWNEILLIITQIISNNKQSSNENITLTITEIIDNIKLLIIKNRFYGNLSDYSNILEESKYINSDSLYIIKTKFKLYKYYDFLENIQSIFIENLNNSKNERLKNHIMEMIRLNYKNLSLKREKIEALVIKYFTLLLFSFEKEETLVTLASLISTICVQTNQTKFLDIVKKVFTASSSDVRILNDNEKLKLVLMFQKNCLILIYNSLLNSGQKEKLEIFHKRIFAFLKEPSDINFLHVLLKFLKNFQINKDFEVYLFGSIISYSEVCINFLCNSISKSKKNKKIFEGKKVSMYNPYVTFKHNKLYEILVQVINKDETNTSVCEEILDLLNYFLKNFYFYKSIRIEKFLNSILYIGDIEKYLYRNRMIEIITEVLFNISFITNKKHINLESKVSNECLFEFTEDNLKEKIIHFCLNSLKSFINIFKTSLNRKPLYENNSKTVINTNSKSNYLNSTPENITYFMMSRSELNQNVNIKTVTTYIKNFFGLLSVYFISIPIGSEKDKDKLKKYTEYANILIDIIYEMKLLLKVKTSLITSILYFFIKTKTVLLILGNEFVVRVIFLILSLGWPNYENDIFKYFSENFNIKLKKFNDNLQTNIDLKRGNSQDLSSGNLIGNNYNSFKINEHKREYINFLSDVACWYYFEHFNSTKIILKILSNVFRIKNAREKIFIDLIKWNIYSKANRDNLKINNRAKIFENSNTYLGKNCILMIIPLDESSAEVIIRNAISNINMTIINKLENEDKNEQSNFETLSSLINVNQMNPTKNNSPHSKKHSLSHNMSRDDSFSYRNEDRSDMPRISETVVLSKSSNTVEKNNRFTLAKVTTQSKEKNNNNLVPLSNNQIPKTSNINIYNTEIIESCPKSSEKNYINPNLVLHQFHNIFSDYESSFQILKNPSQITDFIKCLDSTPVYFTYNCGVLYIPNKNLNSNSEFDIFSYEGEVSTQYLKFLSKIGKVFCLAEYPNIYLGGLDRNGNHGRYSIYHQDILFQIIFHVASLMKKESNTIYDNNTSRAGIQDKNEIYMDRKKVIGNNYINLIFFDNSFEYFEVEILKSYVNFFYILVFPYSENFYFIKLKPNPKSKCNITEKVYKMLFKEIIISHDLLDNVLKKIIIILNLYISYTLQVKSYKCLEVDNIAGNVKNYQQIFELESNITQRFKQIERIIFKYKQ